MSTSVARLMPSMSECRQPYLLSNLDLVTESLTLMAGNSSVPSAARSYSRCTPVVVSSVTPMTPPAILVNRSGSAATLARSRSRMTASSSGSSSVATGTAPACSYSAPWCTRRVASPPSSSSMLGPSAPGQRLALPGEHRHAARVLRGPVRADRDRRGRVVLGGEDVAACPPDLCAERGKRLDQDRG